MHSQYSGNYLSRWEIWSLWSDAVPWMKYQWFMILSVDSMVNQDYFLPRTLFIRTWFFNLKIKVTDSRFDRFEFSLLVTLPTFAWSLGPSFRIALPVKWKQLMHVRIRLDRNQNFHAVYHDQLKLHVTRLFLFGYNFNRVSSAISFVAHG